MGQTIKGDRDMRSLSIRELREALPSIGQMVESEGEVLLTRHGRPLVKLVPLRPPQSAPSHADLRATMPHMSVPSEELVRADRERG
jgi:antitoxin (DNA-binding transcriptional repressor) of toxin-antitoxin stability system